jgi:signal peptidase I
MPTTEPESISVTPVPVPLSRKPPIAAPSILRQGFQCLAVGLMAAASYFLISHFFLQSVKVVGRSMVPTLFDSQHYLLNRWIYYVRAPHQSDIVVLRDPSDDGFSVKRVIATPGDSVFFKGGSVYVNGCKLSESYLDPGTPTYTDSRIRAQLILCGTDQFFVLGDNRLNSVDSRAYGPISRKNILGPIIW